MSALSDVLAHDNSMVPAAAAHALAVFPGDSCVVSLVRGATGCLDPIAIGHRRMEPRVILDELLLAAPSELVDAFSRRVLQTGSPLRMRRLSSDMMHLWTAPGFWPYVDHYGLHSLMAAPLKTTSGQILGAISLWRQDGSAPYSSQSEAFLGAFARRLAQVLAASHRANR